MQDGRNDHFVRPVIILKRYSDELALVAPLTRAAKNGKFYHTLRIHAVDGSRIILSQMRTISSKRLRARIARVPEKEFTEIQGELVALNFTRRET
jgi:mRNA-degrading endonuclease toxin of MazEF toxin-antitoxin module